MPMSRMMMARRVSALNIWVRTLSIPDCMSLYLGVLGDEGTKLLCLHLAEGA